MIEWHSWHLPGDFFMPHCLLLHWSFTNVSTVLLLGVTVINCRLITSVVICSDIRYVVLLTFVQSITWRCSLQIRWQQILVLHSRMLDLCYFSSLSLSSSSLCNGGIIRREWEEVNSWIMWGSGHLSWSGEQIQSLVLCDVGVIDLHISFIFLIIHYFTITRHTVQCCKNACLLSG